MPEAIAVVLVVSLVGVLLLAAWVHARHSAHRHPTQSAAQLQRHLAWLEERLRHAEAHHWGEDMQQRLRHDLEQTCERLRVLSAQTGSGGLTEKK